MKRYILPLVLSLYAWGQDVNTPTQSATGRITAASTACTMQSCVWLAGPLNISSATVQISGTFTGTVQFEASNDGTTYNAITATGASTNTTTTGTYKFSLGGQRVLRMRASALASGSVVVNMAASVGTAGGLGGSTYSDIVALWASGSCSGFLKNDGTCGAGGSGSPGGSSGQFQYNNSAAFGGANLSQNADGSDSFAKTGSWAAAYKPTVNTAGTTTCDLSQGNLCEVDFGAGNTTLAFTNPHASGPYKLRSVQDATGGRTYTAWPSGSRGQVDPSLGTGANDVIEQTFTYDGTNFNFTEAVCITCAAGHFYSPEATGATTTGTGTAVMNFDSGSHTATYYANNSANRHAIPRVASGDQVAFSDVTGAATTGQLPTVALRRVCDIAVGDTSGSAITNAQLGPQKRMCFIPAAATIVEMDVAADGGTPNIIIGKNHAGAVSNIVSGALATAAAGAIACSNAGGTTGIDGATTCSATLQNTSLAAGDYLEPVSGTAGGTAKLMTIHVVYTIN